MLVPLGFPILYHCFLGSSLPALKPLDLGFHFLPGIVVQAPGQWPVVEVGLVFEERQRVLFDLVAGLCRGEH
jgi:hypothetical protein